MGYKLRAWRHEDSNTLNYNAVLFNLTILQFINFETKNQGNRVKVA